MSKTVEEVLGMHGYTDPYAANVVWGCPSCGSIGVAPDTKTAAMLAIVFDNRVADICCGNEYVFLRDRGQFTENENREIDFEAFHRISAFVFENNRQG